jgi:hypothetical protein
VDRDTIATITKSLDYIHINCAKCSQPVKISYRGRKLLVPQFELECETCGPLGEFKLDVPYIGSGWK